MVARKVWLPSLGNWTLEGSGDPFDPTAGRMVFRKGGPTSVSHDDGDTHGGGEKPKPSSPELSAFLECASLCNIASVYQEPAKPDEEKPGAKIWAARGDPTEMCVSLFSTFSRVCIPGLCHLPIAHCKCSHTGSNGAVKHWSQKGTNNSRSTPSPPN